MVTVATINDFQLAWQASAEEDRRFNRFLWQGLIIFLVVAGLATWLPVPEPELLPLQNDPQQLTRVILEPQALPEPKPQPKPVIAEPEVIPQPEPVPVQTKPQPVEQPQTAPPDLAKQARQQAELAGVMAFKDDLAVMRDSIDVSSVNSANLTRGVAQAEQLERNMIAADAMAASGGIQTANLSRDTGGVALSGHQNTRVEAPQGALASAIPNSANTTNYTGRSDEEVRRVMDSHKSVIYALYNRALRKDPTLEGRFVFEMVVEPEGNISSVTALSSDLNDAELEKKLLARIALIQFPAANVSVTRVNYSFDFLPY